MDFLTIRLDSPEFRHFGRVQWSSFIPDGTRHFYGLESETFPVSGAADVIYAGEGSDHVWGGFGNDIIFGEGGADKLHGEDGNDIVMGGAGIAKATNGTICAVLFERIKREAAVDPMPLAA